MICGKKRENPLEVINSKLSDYDIYRMFCPSKFTLNKNFSSPIPGRRDDHPSFVIGNKNGNYYHIDFGDGRFRGGAIDFVMQIENVSFKDALKVIDKRFGLGIYGEEADWKSIVSTYKQPEIKKNEKETHIECHYKRFTDDMHKYWNAYHLTEDYLKNKNTFQVKTLFINRKRFPLDPNEIVIAYLTEDGRKKIYRPTIPRKVKKEEQWLKWRFKSNIPFTYLSGKENIKNCQKSLCLKSKKDELVASLILPCVYSVQAESIACFSKENVEYINNNSLDNYIGFGNDPQGVKECQLITKTFNWKYINVPKIPNNESINDFAEYVKNFGLDRLEEFINNKLT